MGERFDLMVLPEQTRRAEVVKRRGHAAHPGTGPKGETCGGCEHRTSVRWSAHPYSKCALAKANWTRGPGSDIRKKDPACHFWTRKVPQS
jgi:hypothetical protein